mgnify:CR=1 FL=1
MGDQNPKTLYIIRHAESTYNEFDNAWDRPDPIPDPYYFDADISQRGWEQTDQLRSFTESITPPDLIVCSPLKRAILTMENGLSDWLGSDIPVMIHPDVVEMLVYSCDIGTPKSELMTMFPNYDFGLIKNELFWYRNKSSILILAGIQGISIQIQKIIKSYLNIVGTQNRKVFLTRNAIKVRAS